MVCRGHCRPSTIVSQKATDAKWRHGARPHCLPWTYEFVWRKVAKPIQIGKYHEYARHYHLTFNQDGGRTEFREEVNLILARNGLAYELTAYGSIRRLLPAVIGEALARTYFRTGERTLDVLLEESCVKFSDPDPLIRREALERLFDSWERIKSMADDNDKAKSIAIILDRCATEPEFRKMLDAEARELTRIGNSHLFRHHEMKQTPVVDVQQVDYLYHRLLRWSNLSFVRTHLAKARAHHSAHPYLDSRDSA